eukprot:NODE_10134_length_608_cov_50.698969_g9860_i0.p1 GENE.NODE_10134_length_608_cov_50.698969_g9860_i0~~NODE_10134_length_608_cov_50.698969_g9860_i0.p1  ORF type:complete len:132 (+),score=25.56 NODE_10134_length_608_cov_50.698969_g9860_i0:81-476(+)
MAVAIEREVLEKIKAAGTLSEESLRELMCVMPKLLPGALEICDRGMVSKATATPSNRQIWLVKGRSSSHYLCHADFCTCPAFTYACVLKQEQMYCKHLAAVLLGSALNKYQHVSVTDVQLAAMLHQDFVAL